MAQSTRRTLTLTLTLTRRTLTRPKVCGRSHFGKYINRTTAMRPSEEWPMYDIYKYCTNGQQFITIGTVHSWARDNRTKPSVIFIRC